MSIFIHLYRVHAAYHWIRAVSAYKRGDIKKALAHYGRISERAAPKPRHKAFHASLLILDHRSVEARTVFQAVIDDVCSVENPTENERYVLNYSRYYAALIDKTDAERFRLAAGELSPNSYLYRFLPLPPLGWEPGADRTTLDQAKLDAA